MNQIKIFFLIYVVSMAFMYYLSYFKRIPTSIPGDLLIKKGPRTIYVPFASSLLLTILAFIAFKLFLPRFPK